MNEIIDELIVTSEKMGNPHFRNILQECKDKTNEKILSLLQKFNQDYIGYVGREFVEIKDFAFDIKHLVSLKKGDNYDIQFNISTYQIVINSDPQEKLINCNTVIEFSSAEARNHVYDNLKEKLSSTGVVFL